MNTHKNDSTNQLCWDVHFWLGKFTTQDEAGAAAFKTSELVDLLGGTGPPVQHREVQGYESSLFLSYFQNQITLLEGGIDSGFRHVEPQTYRPRLLHLKGIKKVRINEVPIARDSLNSGDVFILDCGLQVYAFNGKESGPMEKLCSEKVCKNIQHERKGVQIHVLEEGTNSSEMTQFFSFFGGEFQLKTAAEGGSDKEAEREAFAVPRVLLRLSDNSGKLEFTKIAEGNKVTRDLFQSDHVFIFDAGNEIFGWVGKKAPHNEKHQWITFAQEYLARFQRPLFLPITQIFEGGETEIFESHFV